MTEPTNDLEALAKAIDRLERELSLRFRGTLELPKAAAAYEDGLRVAKEARDALRSIAAPKQDAMVRIAPAIEQLTNHQTQLDMDGVMVGVSRQALDEVLSAIAAVAEVKGEPIAWRYELDGEVWVQIEREPSYDIFTEDPTETPLFAHPAPSRPADAGEVDGSPRRRVVVELKAEGDSWDDMRGLFRHLETELAMHDSLSTSIVSGGYGSGFILTSNEDESITHDSWAEANEAWCAALRAQEKPSDFRAEIAHKSGAQERGE